MDSVPSSEPAEGTRAKQRHGMIRLGGGAMWAAAGGVPYSQGPASGPSWTEHSGQLVLGFERVLPLTVGPGLGDGWWWASRDTADSSMRTLVLAECPGETEMPVPETEQISELCTLCVGLEVPFGHPGKGVE